MLRPMVPCLPKFINLHTRASDAHRINTHKHMCTHAHTHAFKPQVHGALSAEVATLHKRASDAHHTASQLQQELEHASSEGAKLRAGNL